tara:strand:- start:37 stop:825 length:789 start_codon:yes stop_codon:yes gene_type:complete
VKLKPNKKLGQNFLIDKNIITKIADLIPINFPNEILEIGAGTGNLTEFLINKKPKKIYLIEKDKKLFDVLKSKFENKIEIFNEDILKFSRSNLLSSNSIIFGNLPYNISSQILTKFIFNIDKFKFKTLIFMFQKELADRIIASVNTSSYGRLSILCNWKFDVEKIFEIGPNSFYPKPKIKSTLLIFKPKNKIFNFEDPKSLERITNIFFNQRRKKIKKQFNYLFKNDLEIINKLNLDLNLRPQNLTPETYFKLAKELEKLRN